MFIEYPFKYANILLMKLFWVTGKDALYMDGRWNGFKIDVQNPR